jgi:holo-[acyl-carrier protein] synthase
MTILGIGCDIVDINRISDLCKKDENGFVKRIISDEEKNNLNQITDSKKRIAYIAKRFAAKEAIAKAFGTGIGSNISFTDISILNNNYGAPYVKFSEKINIANIYKYDVKISLSDEWPMAVAFAVISM